ncbi:MAG: S-layer homology domain-containing protein, partial [Nitriliruptoraceae bacterium]
MRLAHRVKRSLVAGLAGAMVFALLPAGVAAAEVIDTDGLDACDGAEGLVDFNDALGFFESNIECMAAYGVTVGDADGNFNSPGSVTRQQMALFIARLATQALNGNTDIPATTDDEFDDIANINPPEARDAINLLASLGIVQGVSESEYDPSGTVTREQMASFVANAHAALEVDFTGFAPDAGVFGDEDEISDVHLDNVLLLADVGVVEGDAAGDYNPGNPVTRGQMSAFIVRSIA